MQERLRAFLIPLVAGTIGLGAAANGVRAEAISTTSCKAAADRTKTKDGKKYNCTSCEACTTTTCQTGGPASCTNTTTTTCTCTEAPPPKRQSSAPSINPGLNPGVLDQATGGGKKRPTVKLPGKKLQMSQ